MKDYFDEIKKLMRKMHEQGYDYITISEMVSGYAYKMTYDPEEEDKKDDNQE